MIQFGFPNSNQSQQQRNILLQDSLRPEPLTYTIDDEYPIVLGSSQKNSSICVSKDNHVIAHANLWKRTLSHPKNKKSFSVGLIGNVATDEKFRGQGIMKQLFQELLRRSKAQGLEALLLWSDLELFYQNMGFTSFSQETRYSFTQRKLKNFSQYPGKFCPELNQINKITDAELLQMLSIRPKETFSLGRSPEEFRQLLHIPDTYLMTLRGKDNEITSFAIIGKGYDMAGVCHEWGAVSHQAFFFLIHELMQQLKWEELLVLAPKILPSSLKIPFEEHSASAEDHNMALCRAVDPHHSEELERALANTFVWGLDSI